MNDLADLQSFLSKVEGGAVCVDLLKIGQKHYLESAPSGKNSKHRKFRVALDIEDCLDRFYGGYFSDWACGGQWNRAFQFVQLLSSAFNHSHIEVIAFFDGTLKKNKKCAAEYNEIRQKTFAVLKHIRMIGTPPPKIWWLPPSGIRTVIRNALRNVHIQTIQTVHDHTMEVIEYFHEQKLDAILGLHPDYIISNTSRYFSSHDIRLSYKGTLETKEFIISKLLASLSLTADHLPFIAVLLGGYILIDDDKLKTIYERLSIDTSLEFEGKLRRIAEIVRNSPTSDIDEFIKHLNLADFEKEIKETVEYYQRKGKFLANKYQGSKKRNELIKPVAVTDPPMPFASETAENDETAEKILNDAISKDDDTITSTDKDSGDKATPADKEQSATTSTVNGGNGPKTAQPFAYTLPAEVIRTSLNRHQRGIMDPKIYQLLLRKEIILPQVLEDEQYREIPSVHLFYRPARQMIYAILFNVYHQKYLCSKRSGNSNNNESTDKTNKKDNKQKDKKEPTGAAVVGQKPPDVQVAEWIWSPQNEYQKPDLVSATPLPWAVPTIQRLWFGMAFDDKQRRMRAFLTIMRSDAPLMLNRGYVPQHMLVMACVLRYIITSPEKNILTRQELDAFLATAFSEQLPMVITTQDLVLPGVYLRGVFLATLFMQGVETASLANDACGVPLPWIMVNPWLFFDGKLFHLKLKMSTYVSTIRELCDDQIEVVLKIERFRKAILEDVEHLLSPVAHMDPMYRPGFLPPPGPIPLQAFNKNAIAAAASSLHPLAASANANNAIFYNPQSPYFALSPGLFSREAVTGVNPPTNNSGRNRFLMANRNNNQNRRDYHLKVGVTGSWAGGNPTAAALAASRSLLGPRMVGIGNRLNNNVTARIGLANRNKLSVNTRLYRNMHGGSGSVSNLSKRGGAPTYGTKVNSRNRNRNKRKDNRTKNQAKNKKSNVQETTDSNSNNEAWEVVQPNVVACSLTDTKPSTTVTVATKSVTIKTNTKSTTGTNAITTPVTKNKTPSPILLTKPSADSAAEKLDKLTINDENSSASTLPPTTTEATIATAAVTAAKIISAKEQATIDSVLDQIGALSVKEGELKNEVVA